MVMETKLKAFLELVLDAPDHEPLAFKDDSTSG